ncbi:MAG TPA: hypothetical protein VH575_21530 [Gemmataceae bacterium]|jgi:hypothetical protein
MHYLLFYEKAADYSARQGPLQSAHRVHLSAAIRRGELLLAGSLADPVDGSAVLLFQADSPVVVEACVAADPFVLHGVVIRPADSLIAIVHYYARNWSSLSPRMR